MTGTASSSGRVFNDFESYKNQEWLRRRRLRIEQVRNQSKEIAKALRNKVENEEKLRCETFERIEEARFKCWKAEKLDEMERKLRCALEEFGLGHKLANAEPCPTKITEIKNKINMWKALERGEIANKEKLRRKKLEQETKTADIQRKKLTRKVEDLRSALLCSVTAQKELLRKNEDSNILLPPSDSKNTVKEQQARDPEQARETDSSHGQNMKKKKHSLKKERKVQVAKEKPSISLNLPPASVKNTDTIWVNLNEIQSSNTSDVMSRSGRIGSSSPEKNKKGVEFYDFNSRYHCKTYREYPNLVEKIKLGEIEKTNDEENLVKMDSEKKQRAINACEERGNEALRKEQIKRNYSELISKLDDLYKKEKLIKAQQQGSSSLIYKNDERLLEHQKMKQRIMNSKFESIYCMATSEQPVQERTSNLKCEEECNPFVAGDDKLAEEISVKLKFSPSNLKPNSSVSSFDAPLEYPYSKKLPSEKTESETQKRKRRKKLLLDIDRALKEGRKLRETIVHNWDNISLNECENEKSDFESNEVITYNEHSLSSSDAETIKTNTRMVQNKESQTDDIKSENKFMNTEIQKVEKVDLGTQIGNHSLALSSSTSYKSPPSELNCDVFHPLLTRLGNISDSEECKYDTNIKVRRKMKKMLRDLLNKRESEKNSHLESSTLRYYVSKLLDMSRERVASLSISSESASMTGSICQCLEPERESACSERCMNPCQSSEEPQCALHDSVDSNKSIQNWKMLLEVNLKNNKECDPLKTGSNEAASYRTLNLPSENNETCQYMEPTHDTSKIYEPREMYDSIIHNSTTYKKLDTATDICSKRISELTDLLHKVRRDKEILLNSHSERLTPTSLSSSRKFPLDDVYNHDIAGGDFSGTDDNIEEEGLESNPTTEVFHTNVEKNFRKSDGRATERYDSIPVGDSIKPVAGSDDSEYNSILEESIVSTTTFPDVMNELLDRKIITSPFKWDGGTKLVNAADDSPMKHSSIETVIDDFRRKISMIKSSSFSSTGAISSNNVPNLDTCEDDTSQRDSEVELDQPQRDQNFCSQESSIGSVDHALTNLGLNWAKSFLRKIEESKAIDSSSCSEDKK
ncbi:hypothetical protein RUM43_000842 [Polyplax serrata]|uniref:Uncharacterized protein n=1 Tax=Polyplax serrata TaxID=468196 RepID=A0AAN8XPN9_POLSC